jgi:hypothetical protein
MSRFIVVSPSHLQQAICHLPLGDSGVTFAYLQHGNSALGTLRLPRSPFVTMCDPSYPLDCRIHRYRVVVPSNNLHQVQLPFATISGGRLS